MASRKKRAAEEQITKDTVEQEEEQDQERDSREEDGPWKQAPEDVLAKRRIVQVRRRTEQKEDTDSVLKWDFNLATDNRSTSLFSLSSSSESATSFEALSSTTSNAGGAFSAAVAPFSSLGTFSLSSSESSSAPISTFSFSSSFSSPSAPVPFPSPASSLFPSLAGSATAPFSSSSPPSLSVSSSSVSASASPLFPSPASSSSSFLTSTISSLFSSPAPSSRLSFSSSLFSSASLSSGLSSLFGSSSDPTDSISIGVLAPAAPRHSTLSEEADGTEEKQTDASNPPLAKEASLCSPPLKEIPGNKPDPSSLAAPSLGPTPFSSFSSSAPPAGFLNNPLSFLSNVSSSSSTIQSSSLAVLSSSRSPQSSAETNSPGLASGSATSGDASKSINTSASDGSTWPVVNFGSIQVPTFDFGTWGAPLASSTIGSSVAPSFELRVSQPPTKKQEEEDEGEEGESVSPVDNEPSVVSGGVTGEEDEERVFQVRAKLFELDRSGPVPRWREKGIGELHLNALAENKKKSRLVMRNNAGLKILLNAAVFPEMKCERLQDKAVNLTVIENGATKSYLLRVAQKEEAAALIEAITKYKAKAAQSPEDAQPQPSASPQPSQSNPRQPPSPLPQRAEPMQSAKLQLTRAEPKSNNPDSTTEAQTVHEQEVFPFSPPQTPKQAPKRQEESQEDEEEIMQKAMRLFPTQPRAPLRTSSPAPSQTHRSNSTASASLRAAAATSSPGQQSSAVRATPTALLLLDIVNEFNKDHPL